MRNTARSNTAKNKDLHTYSSEEVVNNGFGEETKCDQLIVIDDVSGLADESKKFARFLTFACNFNCSCVYIFHIIYPGKTFTNEYFKYFSSKCFFSKCTKDFRKPLYQKNKKVYSTVCSLDW